MRRPLFLVMLRVVCYNKTGCEPEEAMEMALFSRKAGIEYDPAAQEPAVRKSICTGEMTVGFIDRKSGRFQELMRVDGQKGLEEFMKKTGVKELRTMY